MAKLGAPKPVRLPLDLEEKLVAIAKERGGTVQAAIREAVRDYVNRESLIAERDALEARIAGTLSRTRKDIGLVRNEVHVLMALVDRFIRSYLLHTPPVPADAMDAQAATASDRYQKLMREIPAALQNGDALSAFFASDASE